METKQFTCPYCKGAKKLLYTGQRCHICSGFGLVDEMGRRRGNSLLNRLKNYKATHFQSRLGDNVLDGEDIPF